MHVPANDTRAALLTIPLLEQAEGSNNAPPDTAVVVLPSETDSAELPAVPTPVSSQHTTHWLLTTALMMADMFGLGALSLPADFARLGWLPALSCMAWFTLTNVYSGFMYQRLSLKLPQAVVFDEIGAAAFGRAGKLLVFGTVYLTILFEPVIFQLMCMEALQQTFYMYKLSWQLACFIITTLMMAFAQLHNIEQVAWIAVLGSVGMLVAMIVVCVKLSTLYLAQGEPAHTQMASHQGFEVALVGLMDIAFAYGGQQNWMRWISTTKQRNRFAAAASITTGFMSVVYLLTAVTGYAALGTDINKDRPISSVIGQDIWTLLMNAGILVHCIIAYQVIINVWCSTLLHMTMPRAGKLRMEVDASAKRIVWLLVTLLCIGMAAFLAYTLPFFSLMMAVIASLGDVMSMFGLPCLFAIKLLKLPGWEVCWCGLLVIIATGLTGVGVVSSIRQLVAAYQLQDGKQ